MQEEVLRRAYDLARKGVPEDGMQVLRPLLKEGTERLSAIPVLAYCYEKQANLALACYLYQQAVVLRAVAPWPPPRSDHFRRSGK